MGRLSQQVQSLEVEKCTLEERMKQHDGELEVEVLKRKFLEEDMVWVL